MLNFPHIIVKGQTTEDKLKAVVLNPLAQKMTIFVVITVAVRLDVRATETINLVNY